MKRDVLYVDDEIENLVVFEASFEDDFNVTVAQSGQEALELLEQRAFPAVVADQRMPGMTGSQLFEIMRQKYPHTKRLMLTGYADPKATLDAINQGQVYYFIKKPWERDFVFSILLRAIEAYDLSIANLSLTDRLVVMDRCATLGRSAAQIAHEMGNQLCMLPLLELIEDEYADQEDLVRTAEFARKTYDRLVQLINEVKGFIRFENEKFSMQPLRLSAVVHELLEFLRHERSLPLDRISFEVWQDATVQANKVKLHQVLVNLLKNAAHAIRESADGRITLSLNVEQDSALIQVRDNGCGMTPEVAAKIWEPFFTTKGDEGNGLGLDVVRSIITAHGGDIDCQSAPGQGSTFTIRLPAIQSATPLIPISMASARDSAVPVPGG